jgi:hypothetical protein
MKRELIDPWTRIPRSIERSSTSALSDHSLCWAVFIINIAESDFRYAQVSGENVAVLGYNRFMPILPAVEEEIRRIIRARLSGRGIVTESGY